MDSDFKAQDDLAQVPLPPMPDVPAIEEEQQEADIETTKAAQPYWHPAWETVQDKFQGLVDTYSANNALVHKDLPADEFKIRMSAEATVAAHLTDIMEDVKRAVESVDSRPKPGKRPATGGK